MTTFTLKIYRGTPGNQYWESYELELVPGMNIISALMEIRRNPVTIEGKKVSPPAWDAGCLEEVCGTCSMLVNGYPRQSCTALVEPYLKESKTITLAPFTKFPLVRDLIVDRTIMFENLKKVHAWIENDGSRVEGPGPQISVEKQEVMYHLSTCMSCGCCSEGCPQVSEKSDFMGPAAISTARFHNANPTGAKQKRKRLRAIMGEDGINACGNAQNCQKVCPKKIPLLDSIAAMYRDVTLQWLKDLFSFKDRD